MPIYSWPTFAKNTELDRAFAEWAEEVYIELSPVREALMRPLPDDPRLLDEEITHHIDGWLPRVASLAVTAEYFYSQAKLEKLPEKRRGADGKPLNTDADRVAEQEAMMAGYEFVKHMLDGYVRSMRDRVNWAQSVRKLHSDAQGVF